MQFDKSFIIVQMALILLYNTLQTVECFSCDNVNVNSIRQRSNHLQMQEKNHQNADVASVRTTSTNLIDDSSMDRRKAFMSFASKSTTLASLFTSIQPANAADDRLFKPNPLTNPVLEKIRMWEQVEADDIKYGGELAAPGSPKGQDAYAKLLVPILRIQTDLVKVDNLVRLENGSGLDDSMKILNQAFFEKTQFKKIFNAFADNIYYSDPDRANAYLGGGAIPKNEQSIAYLIRNDILTNIENLQAEVAYLIKEKKAGNPLEVDDLFLYSQTCKDDMVKYLELVPPRELKIANEMLSN